MKRTIIFTLTICLLAVFSCKKSESISEKREKERKAIEKLIADSAYQIIDTMPADTIFAPKVFYHSPSGLYLHIINKGEGRKPQTSDKVYFRYYIYDLEGNIVKYAMTSDEQRDADYIKFNNTDSYAKAFNEIVGYLGTEGAAYAIIPSSIGVEDAQTNITPYIYEIRHAKIE